MRRTCPLLLLALAGCLEGAKPTPLQRVPSLYARLGGEPVIEKVVDDFVVQVALSDKVRPEIKRPFVKGDVAGLKRALVEKIGAATGGPQRSGKDATPPAGLGVTDADFDALLEALARALDDNRVLPRDKGELLAVVGPLRKDVVAP